VTQFSVVRFQQRPAALHWQNCPDHVQEKNRVHTLYTPNQTSRIVRTTRTEIPPIAWGSTCGVSSRTRGNDQDEYQRPETRGSAICNACRNRRFACVGPIRQHPHHGEADNHDDRDCLDPAARDQQLPPWFECYYFTLLIRAYQMLFAACGHPNLTAGNLTPKCEFDGRVRLSSAQLRLLHLRNFAYG
jgi:hypothetical protein